MCYKANILCVMQFCHLTAKLFYRNNNTKMISRLFYKNYNLYKKISIATVWFRVGGSSNTYADWVLNSNQQHQRYVNYTYTHNIYGTNIQMKSQENLKRGRVPHERCYQLTNKFTTSIMKRKDRKSHKVPDSYPLPLRYKIVMSISTKSAKLKTVIRLKWSQFLWKKCISKKPISLDMESKQIKRWFWTS